MNGFVLVNFYESRATESRTWQVSGSNPAGGGFADVYAYAHCLSTQPGGVVIAAKKSAYGPSKLARA